MHGNPYLRLRLIAMASRHQHRAPAGFLGGDPPTGCDHRSRIPEVDDPHHAVAILMCEEARLKAPEIKELCATIIASQQAESDKMKAWLGKDG